MVDIPEDLLRRSAEARAKALGVPVEDVLAEFKGEGPPVEVPQPEPEPEPVEEVEPEGSEGAETPEIESTPAEDVQEEIPHEADVPEESPAAMVADAGVVAVATAQESAESPIVTEPADSEAAPAASVDEPADGGPPADSNGSQNGSTNGKVASVVSPRPSVPPAGLPEGVRTQRLLTVVKARAIQNVKAEPSDKVNTWPHLMLMEFGALLAITGLLVVMAVIIHSPLLEPANFNATPNPSKAPWYFLGLQELLSYFDPQIAGVMVPLFIGMIGFMMIPYIDKNPSTRPSDRKFAIMLYSVFLAGSATLTIIGVLFRGRGFNWAYPWRDGVFFDDLKDWVNFE